MTDIKGQIVPIVKPYLPPTFFPSLGQKRPMRELMTPAEFEELFIARTRALREHSGMSGPEMATALGIPYERYKKYENRSPLPHDLIERFALITRVPVDFVMTGRRVTGKGPYPEVPGPHMLEDWRQGRVSLDSGTKRRSQNKS